jgi:hypothetical protein
MVLEATRGADEDLQGGIRRISTCDGESCCGKMKTAKMVTTSAGGDKEGEGG